MVKDKRFFGVMFLGTNYSLFREERIRRALNLFIHYMKRMQKMYHLNFTSKMLWNNEGNDYNPF